MSMGKGQLTIFSVACGNRKLSVSINELPGEAGFMTRLISYETSSRKNPVLTGFPSLGKRLLTLRFLLNFPNYTDPKFDVNEF